MSFDYTSFKKKTSLTPVGEPRFGIIAVRTDLDEYVDNPSVELDVRFQEFHTDLKGKQIYSARYDAVSGFSADGTAQVWNNGEKFLIRLDGSRIH